MKTGSDEPMNCEEIEERDYTESVEERCGEDVGVVIDRQVEQQRNKSPSTEKYTRHVKTNSPSRKQQGNKAKVNNYA